MAGYPSSFFIVKKERKSRMKKKALIVLYILLCVPVFFIFGLDSLFYNIQRFTESLGEKADAMMSSLANKIRKGI